jgi:hypothetical protein
LRDEANRATAWLERLRRLHERNAGTAPRRLNAAGTEGARRQRRRRGPFVARLRRSRAHHGALPPGRLFVYRTRIAWDTGTLVEHTLTTIVVARGVGNSGSGTVSPGVRRMVDAHAARLVDARCVVLSETMDRTEALVRVRRREAAARADARPSRVQLVLFDELMPDDDLEDPEPLIRTAPPPVRLHGTAHLVAVLIVD